MKLEADHWELEEPSTEWASEAKRVITKATIRAAFYGEAAAIIATTLAETKGLHIIIADSPVRQHRKKAEVKPEPKKRGRPKKADKSQDTDAIVNKALKTASEVLGKSDYIDPTPYTEEEKAQRVAEFEGKGK